MLLHLGSVPTLVVSSSESAHEIMQTYDLEFASKPSIKVHKTVFYDSKEIAVAPYGEHWRQAKKTIVLHYLSNKMVQTFGVIRDEETAHTIHEIDKFCLCNKVVNLSDLLSDFLSIPTVYHVERHLGGSIIVGMQGRSLTRF